MDKIETSSPRGSIWHRWDPHLHAPGTLLNDQFNGDWDGYKSRINSSEPIIRALGVTDYFCIDTYREVKRRFANGEYPNVGLIFPNVEMRLTPTTAKSQAINIHLLFSPDDPQHEKIIERCLSGLEFRISGAAGRPYRCDEEGLTELGRYYRQDITDRRRLKAEGANQFKVHLGDLIELFQREPWLQSNCLVAVAGGKNDGPSGLQHDSSYTLFRREIEKFAHIIFSATPSQREFWIGRRHGHGPSEIEKIYGGLKPCLHGSDCHEVADVGAPDLDRYCWLKGDLCFETLRQACLEPESRVFIGPSAPRGALPAQTIVQLDVRDAPWLQTPAIPLNSGLVAVIGARGSGKTALADLVAAGGYALLPHLNDRSFIKRAERLLADEWVDLTWEAGEKTGNMLSAAHHEDLIDQPRVQYLSQQFVDQLCSAEGIKDELLDEIERVIFQAHPAVDRMGADTFDELRELRTSRARASRVRHEAVLSETIAALNNERERRASRSSLIKQHNDGATAVVKDKKDRESLIGKGQQERVDRLNQVTSAADVVRSIVDAAKRRERSLLSISDEVKSLRETQGPNWLSRVREENEDSELTDTQWQNFVLTFVGDVDNVLLAALTEVRKSIASLAGPPAEEMATDPHEAAPLAPYFPDDADLVKQTLGLLEKEQARLQRLIGIDAANAKKLAVLTDKIAKQESALLRLTKEIQRASQADERIQELNEKVHRAYEGVIESRIAEERELAKLYEPLREQLALQSETLKKLTFSVRRVVDIEKWADAGEELLDLRANGPFKGRGTLLEAARSTLLTPWERGSAADASQALADFRESHREGLIAHAPVATLDKVAYRAWAQKVFEWLHSTDHISLSYGVQYDLIDIERLSPGTRGIVLLLLYLAVDAEDDRPLLIDQPEENLDPQSIFQELVHRFREAKTRRQIIIVTHNANLVVNTDADQVIVASCGPHRPGKLPEITYESGGLENPEIRKHVCNILEGGEAAFRERAKRLRVDIRNTPSGYSK